MPGDIVTHASFNFRRSVRYLPLQEPIQLRLHVLPVLHLRRTVQLPVGHDQLYMALRPVAVYRAKALDTPTYLWK